MTIYTELSRIQKELKAPKGQYNSFGKYKYRSCEDIVEAVKPILGGCSLTISDEMVLIGDRYYIKATARLALSTDDFVESSAFAREPLDKKGMDESQITGATSSYARKYALNGLFAIDDTKDADATNEHGKAATPAKTPTDSFRTVGSSMKAAATKAGKYELSDAEIVEKAQKSTYSDEELATKTQGAIDFFATLNHQLLANDKNIFGAKLLIEINNIRENFTAADKLKQTMNEAIERTNDLEDCIPY